MELLAGVLSNSHYLGIHLFRVDVGMDILREVQDLSFGKCCLIRKLYGRRITNSRTKTQSNAANAAILIIKEYAIL